MKNSTAKSSPAKTSVKKKVVKAKVPPKPKLTFKGERTLGGLTFKTSVPHHASVAAWIEAGAPDDVYVLDTVDNLVAANIPVVDSKVIRGLYVKIRPGKKVKCSVNTVYAPQVFRPEVHTTVKGIKDANTKDHHVMVY